MSEDYTLIDALKNIKNKCIAYALKEDLIETAKRYPTLTIAACIVNRCILGNENDLYGFKITHNGNLKYSDEELCPTGEWVKAEE